MKLSGIWLSGRTLASHLQGPGFNPQHQKTNEQQQQIDVINMKHEIPL